MAGAGVRALVAQPDLAALLGAGLAERLGVAYPDTDGRLAQLARAVLRDG